MGIYIPNMDMPTNCKECKLLIHPCGCPFAGSVWRAIMKGGISEYCPLVPVPPHGDLIDRDALMNSDEDLWDGMWGYSGMEIMNAPTIIPATNKE